MRVGLYSALVWQVSLSNMVFLSCFTSHPLRVQMLHPTTYTFSQPGWERYLRLWLITCRLGGWYTKGIKMVWTCGPGSKLNMRVRINCIPSGVSMERKLGRLSLSPVGCLATTSNDSRGWKFCGKKSTLLFNRNIGSLLKWLNILNTCSSLESMIVSRIGINPSERFVMRQLRSVLMRSIKWTPRLRKRSKLR